MAKILPFKPILPNKKYIGQVSTKSINGYTKEEIEELHLNKNSFIHIVQPDYKVKPGTEGNTNERFKKVNEAFNKALDKGIFTQEKENAFIIYQQETPAKTYTGIIAGASTEDYEKGKIKKHEQTLSAREKIFTDYLKICGFNAEPVLLTYKSHISIDDFIKRTITSTPHLTFKSDDDQTIHSLWLINTADDIQLISDSFTEIDHIYIADGHHRSASSYRLSKQSNEKGILAYFVSDHDIEIYDFNRVVEDLNKLSKSDFINQLKESFAVEKLEELIKPTQKHHFTMYIDGETYLLKLKDTSNMSSAVDALDADILTKKILSPILNIQDLKTDNRISFVSGKYGVKPLKGRVDSGKYRVGFCLYPVSYQELTNIADNEDIMPPKSTWIEPKLRTGLTIYKFND